MTLCRGTGLALALESTPKRGGHTSESGSGIPCLAGPRYAGPWVWLPAVRPGPCCSGRESEVDMPRVLVVDDELDARELLQAFLVAKGYAVVTASDGEEALQKVKEERPHLILLDVRLPKMNGLEVRR